MGKVEKIYNPVKIGELESFFEKGRNGIMSIKDKEGVIDNTACKNEFNDIFKDFKDKVAKIENHYSNFENCKVNLGFKSFKTEFYSWKGGESDKTNNFETNCKKYFAELYAKCINNLKIIDVSKKQYFPNGKEKPKKIDGETAQWLTTLFSRVLTAAAALLFTLALCGVIPKSALGMTDANADAYFYIIDAAICLLPTGIVWLIKYIYDKHYSKYNVFDSMYQKYSTGRKKFWLYLCFPLKTRARDKGLASDILISECDCENIDDERKYLNLAGYCRLDIAIGKDEPAFVLEQNRCVYISEKSLSAEAKKIVIASYKGERYITKNYWDVASLSQTFGTAIIVGFLLKSKTFEDDVLEKIKAKLIDYYAGYEESGTKDAIMAKSITDSLYGRYVEFAKKDVKPVKEDVKSHLKEAKDRCYYFISAITYKHKDKNPTGERTLDYLVAQKLVEKLGKNNVFWWDNNPKLWKEKPEWPISTEIATGLGFSTVFIGLAFDSIKKEDNTGDRYIYSCLFDDDRAYKKPAYFKHEFETFAALEKSKINSKRFVKGIVPKGQFKSLVPQERYLRFYTLGDLSEGKHIEYPTIYNRNYKRTIENKLKEEYDEISKAEENLAKAEESKKREIKDKIDKDKAQLAKDIAETIYGQLKNENLIKPTQTTENSQEKTPQKPAQPTENSQEDKYKYLYAPFDPNVIKFDKGKYYDNFLGPEWGVSTDPSKDLGWIKEGSKENIESIPIDYFFEYAIVDSETGKNAKNHFLVFPEKYNDEDGNFKWRLKLVVRDWNMCAIWDNNYRVYLTDINANPINNLFNKKFFPLTQYSMIEFFKEKRAITSECSPYDAVTDRKYSDIVSEGCSDSHGAYILNKDVFNENAPIYHLYGTLRLCNKDEQNYSKTFCISINFYPERVDYNKTGIKLFAISPSLSKTKARCPYCGRIKAEDNKKENRNLEYCNGAELLIRGNKYRECEYNFVGKVYHLKDNDTLQIVKSIDKNRDGKEVVGDFGDVFEKIKEGLDNKNSVMPKIEDKNLRLLYKSEYDDGVVVSMVGISQSGKSTIISKMFSVDKGYNISTAYLANAMKPYCKNVKFIPVQSSEMLDKQGSDYSALGISGLRLCEDYKSPLYEKFLFPTPSGTDPVVTHIPYAIELQGIQSAPNRNIYMSFFDVPGSIFETDKYVEYNSDYTMLKRSDSIILLLDNNNADDKQKANSYMISLMQNLDKNTIVAVVFCKADELFSIRNEAGNLIYDFSGDKSIVRHLSPVSKGNKYGGSKRQKYVDKCSKTIRDMMMNGAGTETTKNNIRELERQFNKIKFFTVSSIGRSDSIIKKPGTSPIQKYVLYNTSPFNIENVLLWILYEKGIIE